jgi:hypothetical protein
MIKHSYDKCKYNNNNNKSISDKNVFEKLLKKIKYQL